MAGAVGGSTSLASADGDDDEGSGCLSGDRTPSFVAKRSQPLNYLNGKRYR